MPILSKKILIPTISLTSIGGIYLTKSLISKKEEKITSKIKETIPEPKKLTIKERFKNKNSSRVLVNTKAHDKVGDAILKEYKKSPDPNLPIPIAEVNMQKIKDLCSSLEISTDENRLDQYEKYCTRDTGKNSIPNLITVGDKDKWDKQKQKYDGQNLPITSIKDREELPDGCESRYDNPMDDKKDNLSDGGNLNNGCTGKPTD